MTEGEITADRPACRTWAETPTKPQSEGIFRTVLYDVTSTSFIV
jgi:hypothetical protein